MVAATRDSLWFRQIEPQGLFVLVCFGVSSSSALIEAHFANVLIVDSDTAVAGASLVVVFFLLHGLGSGLRFAP